MCCNHHCILFLSLAPSVSGINTGNASTCLKILLWPPPSTGYCDRESGHLSLMRLSLCWMHSGDETDSASFWWTAARIPALFLPHLNYFLTGTPSVRVQWAFAAITLTKTMIAVLNAQPVSEHSHHCRLSWERQSMSSDQQPRRANPKIQQRDLKH